jgi:two-component system, chemotaxis family, protein-glutamate methylesterase/glutaminase
MEEDKITKDVNLVMIGGSSGSLDAILKILSRLHVNYNTPVIVIMHRNLASESALEKVLSFKTHLQVKEAEEKMVIQPGYIYVAPADYHLLVEKDGSLSLDVSEKVNYSRPSIDVTVESAANSYHKHLLLIILSGANADGAKAAAYAKELGSRIIVQDPREAIVPYMPEHVIAQTVVDAVLPTAGIASLLNDIR